ncbi:MAG: protein-tyrosine phosphatase family protein [Gammaproteobacteria bacterium]
MATATMYKVGTMGDGFLAIMACPTIAADAPASFSNIAGLGINLVVSLLEPSEARSLGLDAERLEVKAHGMEFISFPIPDMGLPASVLDFASLTKALFAQVNAGSNTLVHCRAGIGRSGLLSAGVLLHAGMDPEEAFTYVSRMRGIRVPETPDQRDWLVSNYPVIVAQR